MNKRYTGVGFCFIAAFLFASRYIGVAILGSGILMGEASFKATLNNVGTPLLFASIISLALGICYLILAEKEDNN
ncbi:MAG: hypothetical protein RR515_04455 [Clostridium sp.]